jgi:hypothetical protein
MKKIVLLLTFLLNGYIIAGDNDDGGTNNSNPIMPGNFDGGGSLHNTAVITVSATNSGYTAVNGFFSTAASTYQIVINLSESDIEQVGLAWHVGTSDPDLTQANYAMQSGSTMSTGAKNGWPTIGCPSGTSGKSCDQSYSASTNYTFTVTYDALVAAMGNLSDWNSAAKRDGKRLYLAMVYYDNSSGWELDEITDNALTEGSAKPYLKLDEVASIISDIKEESTARAYTDCGCSSYTSATFGVKTANFTYDLDDAITSSKITYTRTHGSGSTSIVKTNLLATTTAGNDHASRDWDGDGELTNGDYYDIYIEVTDAAGNIDKSLSTGGGDFDDVKYDKTAPTITGVHSQETANSTFVQGQTVDFYAQFSEKVIFDNDVEITLKSNTSATVDIACHTCTDRTDKAYFNWAVPDGAYSKYLDYSTRSALAGRPLLTTYALFAMSVIVPASALRVE